MELLRYEQLNENTKFFLISLNIGRWGEDVGLSHGSTRSAAAASIGWLLFLLLFV